MISTGLQTWRSPVHHGPRTVITLRFFQIHNTHSKPHLSNIIFLQVLPINQCITQFINFFLCVRLCFYMTKINCTSPLLLVSSSLSFSIHSIYMFLPSLPLFFCQFHQNQFECFIWYRLQVHAHCCVRVLVSDVYIKLQQSLEWANERFSYYA